MSQSKNHTGKAIELHNHIWSVIQVLVLSINKSNPPISFVGKDVEEFIYTTSNGTLLVSCFPNVLKCNWNGTGTFLISYI